MADFVIVDAVVVKGGGIPHRVTIPPNHLKYDEDSRFIHISTVPNFSVYLFGRGRDNVTSSRSRPLSRTDVFEQLTNARNLKIDGALSAITKQCGGETLSAFSHKTTRRVKMIERSQLTSAMEIEAPQINDVPGITMKVMTHTKRAPLYIELTPENLAYVRAACLSQMNAGDVQRHRAPKVRKTVFRKRRSKSHIEYAESGHDETQSSIIDVARPSPSSFSAPPEQVTPEKGINGKRVDSKITQFFKHVANV